MNESVIIHHITKQELEELLFSSKEIPDITINAKQAQKILSCSYKTLMSYVDQNLLFNYGKKRPAFKLKETIGILQNNPRYKRFRNINSAP